MPENAMWVRCEPCKEQRRIAKWYVTSNEWVACGSDDMLATFFREHSGYEPEHRIAFHEENPEK